MIKIAINWGEIIYAINVLIVKPLIIKDAYKGYCRFVEKDSDGRDTPLRFCEFGEFEFWKILLSYKMYLRFFKKKPHLFYFLFFDEKGILKHSKLL